MIKEKGVVKSLKTVYCTAMNTAFITDLATVHDPDEYLPTGHESVGIHFGIARHQQ